MKRELLPVVQWLGLDTDELDWDLLVRYESWLRSEALEAGGIGPHEADRLTQRHIGDSLSYGRHIASGPILDVGSGVGLPGIPLAIAYPELEVTTLDRSERRVELVERAVRVLGLSNVHVRAGSVDDHDLAYPTVVTRAVFPVTSWATRVAPRIDPHGIAITSVGGSSSPDRSPTGFAFRVESMPPGVLDHDVTFLIMTRTE